tara:strand:+ start:1167 stop:1316 length:150 start_codon:yes stop_codon:yes gene_type:complete
MEEVVISESVRQEAVVNSQVEYVSHTQVLRDLIERSRIIKKEFNYDKNS